MNPRVTIRTLTDGGQAAVEVAAAIADVPRRRRRARSTWPSTTSTSAPRRGGSSADALRRAAARGVYVRLAYNVDHARPIPVPAARLARRGADRLAPARGAADRRRPRPDAPQVRDPRRRTRSGRARRTGRTTPGRARRTWSSSSTRPCSRPTTGTTSSSSCDDRHGRGQRPRRAGAGTTASGPGSRPGHGEDLSHRIARGDRPRPAPRAGLLAGPDRRRRCSGRSRVPRRRQARPRRLRRCAADGRRGPPVAGEPWRLEAPAACSGSQPAGFSAKHSTPFGAGDVHDFMHAKLTVADDTVFVGLVQPLALGRAERRERARDRGRRSRRPPGRVRRRGARPLRPVRAVRRSRHPVGRHATPAPVEMSIVCGTLTTKMFGAVREPEPIVTVPVAPLNPPVPPTIARDGRGDAVRGEHADVGDRADAGKVAITLIFLVVALV